MLELKYLENIKKFSVYNALPDTINTYNENIHSTTKFKPNFLFNIKIIHQVLENIKKSQRKNKSVKGIKINSKCLMSEIFDLKKIEQSIKIS